VRVRQAIVADLPAIMNLEHQAASAAHWPREHYDQLFLSIPNSASERCTWIAEEDRDRQPEVLGFLIARRMNDECELENVVVSATARRTGVGRLLLTQLLTYTREARVSSIFLEVRESNLAARRLYEKSSFEIAGLRKNYYSDPQENAVLYRLELY
jgi:[ribosomal protein S18]-alanine N-acetyltransferase